MALDWKQEERFSAKGDTGKFFRIAPHPNGKYGATETYLDDNGNMATNSVGAMYDSLDEAKTACEEALTVRRAKAGK